MLLAVMAIGILTGIEALTRVAVIAQYVGTFTSPIHLTGWMKFAYPPQGSPPDSNAP